jgi:lipoyl(octanoyl) transferase
VAFAPTAALQERVRADVLNGSSPGELLLCEHEPVVTLGRSADPANLLVPEATLAAAGVAVVRASRGGDVTYHGPGQLVAYPIVRLRRGIVAHVEAMARAVIELLAQLGIEARWSRERPGVWVDGGAARARASKVCAFGVHARRGVATHGLALNVTEEPLARDRLASFASIVPCGLGDADVTSIATLAPAARVGVAELAPRLAMALATSLDLPIVPEERGQPSAAIAKLVSA